MSSLILQPFGHFTYVTTLFPNASVALPTSQLILSPFHFSYVTSSSLNSPGEPAELNLQPFRHFTYVTTLTPTLPSFYLRHSSFSNPFVSLPALQLILQPLFRISYVTCSSFTSSGEPPMQKNTSIVPYFLLICIYKRKSC